MSTRRDMALSCLGGKFWLCSRKITQFFCYCHHTLDFVCCCCCVCVGGGGWLYLGTLQKVSFLSWIPNKHPFYRLISPLFPWLNVTMIVVSRKRREDEKSIFRSLHVLVLLLPGLDLHVFLFMIVILDHIYSDTISMALQFKRKFCYQFYHDIIITEKLVIIVVDLACFR